MSEAEGARQQGRGSGIAVRNNVELAVQALTSRTGENMCLLPDFPFRRTWNVPRIKVTGKKGRALPSPVPSLYL